MSSKTINWNPVSQLPLYFSLLEKMFRDTKAKQQKLLQSLEHPKSISDSELAKIMHVLHRQTENYPLLIEQLNRWYGENPTIAEKQMIENSLICNEEVLKLTQECQSLINKLKDKTVESNQDSNQKEKKEENEGPINKKLFFKKDMLNKGSSNNDVEIKKYYSKKDYCITEDQQEKYKQIRNILRDLYPKFMSMLDRDAVFRSARRVEISHGKALLLNTEHEMNFFYDYCLYNYRRSGINVIQRGFNRFFKEYSGDKLKIFEAAKNGYFAYLEIVKPVADSGLVVYDRIRDQEHLMIDNGLNKVAYSTHQYFIITHVLLFKDFIITTGASTPVAIHTEAGLKVQRRFERHVKSVESDETTNKEVAQYITDMYKICLHEDIAGQIDSPTLPFGREELKKRIISSDLIH